MNPTSPSILAGLLRRSSRNSRAFVFINGFVLCASVFLWSATPSLAAEPSRKRPSRTELPAHFEGAKAEVYKKVGNTELKVWIFNPESKATNRPAMVFFFGGGWTSGTPAQFEHQARHFAARGMVAITADYRVRSRQGVTVHSCVEDAKSCIRWVRKNAVRLGIDPNRIVAAGGSAGGHLAAATATLPGFNAETDDQSISPVPNALVLFNPALVLAPLPGMDLDEFQKRVGKERLGADPRSLSPVHHVKGGTPPTIIFHGKADSTVPFETAKAFAEAMKTAGNRCELAGYEGQSHGFFNRGRAGGYYDKTLQAADDFLVSLKFLQK